MKLEPQGDAKYLFSGRRRGKDNASGNSLESLVVFDTGMHDAAIWIASHGRVRFARGAARKVRSSGSFQNSILDYFQRHGINAVENIEYRNIGGDQQLHSLEDRR